MTAWSGKNRVTLIFTMKALFKRIISFIFILLGCTPLLFTLFMTIQKKGIRERMREKMEIQRLQTIVLRENDVIWMDDHEIWINNQMFDIRARKLENGVYTFTGMYDEEETKLVNHQKEATGKNNDENKLLSHVFKCLGDFYYESVDEKLFPAPLQPGYSLISSQLTEYIPSIPSPPPQM